MRQTKTILFLTRLYHPYLGGVEKHVKELSKELLKVGYKVNVITESNNINLPRKENIDGVKVFRIFIGNKGFSKKFTIWKWIYHNLELLKSADIIHVHDVFYWILPFKIFLLYKKIYITFHGYEGYPIRRRWIIQRKVSEMLANGSICIGDFMKKWYKANPNYVCYGGVRIEKFKKVIPDSQSAVFFGRLDQQTGIEQYLEAYKIIRKKYPKFRLTVVGEGEFSDKLPKDVFKKPFTEDIEQYIYSNRFIFVSRYLSILEALAARREVIAVYDNPVKEDYLKMSPFKKFIYLESNPESIANFVIKNINKEKKVEINSDFDWKIEYSWKKMSNIYQKLWGETY